ncbi:LOW QUALITY PROTEIN: uncharacterized protein TMEM132E-DT-like [Hylobates moloch]|uniref:LOW QUALITY PROTEIN: uncharacterized protein TMEM132E-DT-like n=1 Tax=Hylobates moloch TaxID=81572 RepID=UPI0013636534|nr:LOW QUALITY PROTEIN: uncharacterized protein TMEM132E-DT-like [Hylobates moloch]
MFDFSFPTPASAGTRMGPASYGGRGLHLPQMRFSRVDATAVADVPFQRMHAPHRPPEVFCSRSPRGAGRGHPTPIPRVRWALAGYQPRCCAQLLSGRGGSGAQLRAGWVRGAAVGNLFISLLGKEDGEEKGTVRSYRFTVHISNITGIIGTTVSKTKLALVLMELTF